MRIAPVLRSKKCRIVWLDMKQPSRTDVSGAGQAEVDDHWWPGMGRWRLGMSCEDAVLELGEPEILDDKKTR